MEEHLQPVSKGVVERSEMMTPVHRRLWVVNYWSLDELLQFLQLVR